MRAACTSLGSMRWVGSSATGARRACRRLASMPLTKASENSFALWKRSSRFLASALCTAQSSWTEIFGLNSEGLAGRSFSAWRITSALLPVNGRRAASSS
jgi:hypothetical protein